MTGRGDSDDVRVVQNVIAFGGFAYGVVNGDLYVHGDGRPVYTVQERRPPTPPPVSWLLALPSRLLDARHQIVEFAGRTAELATLTRWRDGPARLSVLYLHGPGGQGKTRLAARFADQSAADRWKVLEARHGGDTITAVPGSQDLAAGDAPGLLLVVDYADRWPMEHLDWLLANRLLHTPVPTRVLLVGRSVHTWPGIQHALNEVYAETEDLALPPLAGTEDERRDVFEAARTEYSRLYGTTGPGPIPPLRDPGFALVLSLHMAALVAVDAQATGAEPPADPARLSAYLLRREHSHWARLHARSAGGFATPPDIVARAAFTSGLTGSQPTAVASRLIEDIQGESRWPVEVSRVLTDHAVCYPAGDGRFLEPLYPDRLAEDFLALQLPGHGLSGYPADSSASEALDRLVRRGASGVPPEYLDRAMTYLAAAATRWAHVGDHYLIPLLRTDARLAVDAGTALADIAALPGLDRDLLETLDGLVSDDEQAARDVPRAILSERLLDTRLAAAADDVDRSEIWRRHAKRLNHAGRLDEAIAAVDAAIAELREDSEFSLPPDTPLTPSEVRRRRQLSSALHSRATVLRAAGRVEDALHSATEAHTAIWPLANADPDHYLLRLLNISSEMAIDFNELGHRQEALKLAANISAHLQLLASENRDNETLQAQIAASSGDIAQMHAKFGQIRESLQHADLAVDIYRRLAATNAGYLPELARALISRSGTLRAAGRPAEANGPAEESTRIRRELFEVNPARFCTDLAMSLNNYAAALDDLGRYAEALPLISEAVELRRELTMRHPARHVADLAMSLRNLSHIQYGLGRYEQAAAAAEEAVATYREADAYQGQRRSNGLPLAINTLAEALRRLGRLPEVLVLTAEASALLRQSAAQVPEAFTPDLAMALFEFARARIEATVEVDEAVAACREAVALYSELRLQRPSAFIRELAACQYALRMAESLQTAEASQ